MPLEPVPVWTPFDCCLILIQKFKRSESVPRWCRSGPVKLVVCGDGILSFVDVAVHLCSCWPTQGFSLFFEAKTILNLRPNQRFTGLKLQEVQYFLLFLCNHRKHDHTEHAYPHSMSLIHGSSWLTFNGNGTGPMDHSSREAEPANFR